MAERLNRAIVVARAADLADQIGLEELTFTRLARTLGVAPPALYRHAADLADLRRAVATLASRELASELTRVSAGLSGREALAAAAIALRAWAREHPGRYAAVQVAQSPDDEESAAAGADLLGAIASLLRSYRLDGEDLTDAVRFVRSAIHGFVALELAGGFQQARSLDESFSRIIDSVGTSLERWSA